MTVHGAKGQAPIVFLPDTSQSRKSAMACYGLMIIYLLGATTENAVGPAAAARSDAIKRQNQEYRRLLYVALTRAEDRLYICGWQEVPNQLMETGIRY